MLTWALCWMSVQMARMGREIDWERLTILLFIAIVADALVLGLGGWAIIEGLLKCP